VLDANNNIVDFIDSVAIPSRRTSFSPRIDYQINKNHTLVARYNYAKNTRLTGVGGFNLPSAPTYTENSEQGVQLTETAIINKTIVNETRFSFETPADFTERRPIRSRRSTCRTRLRAAVSQVATHTARRMIGKSATTLHLQWAKLVKGWRASSRSQHRPVLAAKLRWPIHSSVVSVDQFWMLTMQPTGGTSFITSIERYRRTQVFSRGTDGAADSRCSAVAQASFVCRPAIRSQR
jgi:hypothetical protein